MARMVVAVEKLLESMQGELARMQEEDVGKVGYEAALKAQQSLVKTQREMLERQRKLDLSGFQRDDGDYIAKAASGKKPEERNHNSPLYDEPADHGLTKDWGYDTPPGTQVSGTYHADHVGSKYPDTHWGLGFDG